MLTLNRLKELVRYEPDTGHFVSLGNSSRRKAGLIMGSPRPDGYLSLGVDKRTYLGHRLAFFYMTGRWPTREIDHIDRDRMNNRWDNLREATGTQNQANRGMQSNNTSGYRGVSWDKSRQKWAVRTQYKGSVKTLGRHDTPEEAARAYDAFLLATKGDYANLNFPTKPIDNPT
jgi:hypothetical protein